MGGLPSFEIRDPDGVPVFFNQIAVSSNSSKRIAHVLAGQTANRGLAVQKVAQQEQEGDAMAALRDNPKSAPTSENEKNLKKTLHNTEKKTHRHRESGTATGG